MAQSESLFDVPVPRKHRNTRDTCIASYVHGRETFTGRKADVLCWLSAHWNVKQTNPTSAELSEYARHRLAEGSPLHGKAERLLYVRRGLSDLQLNGVVEVATINLGGTDVQKKRICAVTGRVCCVWRVVQR